MGENTPTLVSSIFSQLTAGAQSFITFLTNLFQNVIAVFWNSTNNSLTDVGILFVTAISVGFVYFGIRYISRLIKFRA